MLKIKRIDHVAICVADLDDAAASFRTVLGLEPSHREVVASQKTEALLLRAAKEDGDGQLQGEERGANQGVGSQGIAEQVARTEIELIAPRGNASLDRFLEKRGPGLHHIAVEIEEIEGALAFLKGLGVPLIDETPRVGARGHKVAFVHPKATGGVLIELVERGCSGPEKA